MAIDSVFASLLSISRGTTAPFSAISGPFRTRSMLCCGALPPSILTTSSTFLASKAALFHSSARAGETGNKPAAAISERSLRSSRRCACMGPPSRTRFQLSHRLLWPDCVQDVPCQSGYLEYSQLLKVGPQLYRILEEQRVQPESARRFDISHVVVDK